MPVPFRPASSPCETEKTWPPPLWRQGLAGRRRWFVVLVGNYATAQGFAQSRRRAGLARLDAAFFKGRGCLPPPPLGSTSAPSLANHGAIGEAARGGAG